MSAVRQNLVVAPPAADGFSGNWHPCFLTEDQAKSLLAHLNKIPGLDDGYAEFMVQEIDASCDHYTKVQHEKGTRKPHDLDCDIDRRWDQLNNHHTGGTQLKDYWDAFYSYAHLLKMRDCGRTKGSPAKQERRNLILDISDLYPDGISRKSRGGHFAQTVQWVLGFVKAGKPSNEENIYGMICDAFVDCECQQSDVIKATWRSRRQSEISL